MSPDKAFKALAASLKGQPISHVWRGYGSAVSIEIGKLHPVTGRDGTLLQPEGDISLGVEWSWRIEHQHAILCGSWSDDNLWEPAFNLLRGTEIVQFELFGALPEITLTNSLGVRFLTFSTTDGQPQWNLKVSLEQPPRWFFVRDGRLYSGDGSEPAY